MTKPNFNCNCTTCIGGCLFSQRSGHYTFRHIIGLGGAPVDTDDGHEQKCRGKWVKMFSRMPCYGIFLYADILDVWTTKLTWINTIKPEKVYDICHDLLTFMDVRPCQNHDFRNSKFCWRQEVFFEL